MPLEGSQSSSAQPMQAISQGLYALGKLQHVPSDAILHAICSLVPTKVTAATIDRQAVGNTMWAMAELGVKPSNTLYRQLMQLVMIHASKFMPNHFSQVEYSLHKPCKMRDNHREGLK